MTLNLEKCLVHWQVSYSHFHFKLSHRALRILTTENQSLGWERPSSVVEKDYGQRSVCLLFLSPPFIREWHCSRYLTSSNINFLVHRELNKSYLVALLKGLNQLPYRKYWAYYLTHKKPSITISPLPHFLLFLSIYTALSMRQMTVIWQCHINIC